MNTTERESELLRVHGEGLCYICGKPKTKPGKGSCSYPHGRLPLKPVDSDHEDGFWEWE